MTYDDLGRETSVKYPIPTIARSTVITTALFLLRPRRARQHGYAALTYDPSAVGKFKNIAYGNGVSAVYTYSRQSV